MDFTEFVLSHLPVPSRVLEVGCGRGHLTRALVDAGHDALGIDPAAPTEPPFRRIKLEDLEQEESFDAVVASHVLHHVTDVDVALDRVAAHLRPGGLLLVDEQGWDLLDDATAEWYWAQRRVLAAARGEQAPPSVEALWEEWRAEHVGLHGYARLRDELDRRFREVHFSWEPLLHRHLHGFASEGLERSLIDAGAIQPLGFRYVGERLP
ncbi:MAG TPA: class I SAM-dependent methyltransferase [Gaiellaceae bacterium]|nr:class I SAM-dependent methyltransferase [Gaiellaceae bacterium]